MPQFLNLLRLKGLLVLAFFSMPIFAQACFILNQPSTPIFGKQGSTTIATYTVTGNVFNALGQPNTCNISDFFVENGLFINGSGYSFDLANFKMTNVKALTLNCSVSNTSTAGRAVYNLPTDGNFCNVSFNMVYPLTGSYTGNDPLNDKIFTPRISFRVPPEFGSSTTFTNPITIPPEPARTCSLTHPGTVTMAKTKPSDFFAALLLQKVGGFSVTLNCPSTTSTRSGIPRLQLTYPSVKATNGLCFATNQADPVVASPVLVHIKRVGNAIVCGDSAVGQGSVQDFATFTNSAAYSSTLGFELWITSLSKNPAPGVFTTSVTLQVQYP